MLSDEINIRYIGGPTALFQIGGLRFITDPTFDVKDTEYKTGSHTLHKLSGPLIQPQQLDKMDFVLLTHDQHADNLDQTGHEYLNYVEYIFTTPEAASRLGGHAVGMKTWQSMELETKDGRTVILVSTPGRQGNGERGTVTGFLLYLQDDPAGAVYITGDTDYYEGLKEVASRYDVRLVLPFLGAAKIPALGDSNLSMTVAECINLAQVFDKAVITPLHFEGWSHLTEGARTIQETFTEQGLLPRLKWPYGFNTNTIKQKN